MRITHRDLLAPANLVTLIGFALTAYGSMRLYTLTGFISASLGRILDVLDGPIARRTHTSRFGAVLDATVDKFTVLFITLGLLAYKLAPAPIILYILVQNGIVTTLNLIAAQRHIVIHTTRSGKLNIFLQMCCMLVFAAAHHVSGWQSTTLILIAYSALLASIPYALASIRDYLHLQKTESKS